MILLLDMDGPMADFDLHMWDLIQAQGYICDIEGLYAQRSRFLTDHLSKADRAAVRQHVNTSRWFSELPVTAGAQEGVEELCSAGIDVWVCTKPVVKNDHCRDDKGRWIRQHFPDLEHKLIITPDKRRVHGDLLLDDAIPMEWLSHGSRTWAPMVFRCHWHQHVQEKYLDSPLWTWGDPVEELFERVAKYREMAEF